MVPRLVTDRLRLREWQDGDLTPFAAMNADPRVMRLLQGPMTLEASAASLGRIRQQWDDQDWGLFAVERRDTSTFVGFCGLAPVTFDASFSPKVEIGWRLASEQWGHGFATEAASAVLDWAFGDLHWPEVISFTREENTASRAVMERLGMVREPEFDFDLPSPPGGEGRPRHLFYRLRAESWRLRAGAGQQLNRW
jgi:RimJ/RimL family protein N-acetyltransferase